MKRNIGSKLALYPTPAVVIGAKVENKTTWTLVAHTGIVAHDRLLVSLHSAHYINKGIKQTGRLSVNIVTEDFLPEADLCGIVSGNKTDKSGIFDFTESESGIPMIDHSPLTMDCKVEDVYECNGFENFICSVSGTYSDDSVIDDNGKIDYTKLHPVIFEMPGYHYLRTGEVIGKCTTPGKALQEK